jgi:NAD+ synthase (glutamine-hydrolysing)
MRLKVGAAALNTTPIAWKNNLRAILDTITAAAREGVQVLCLPELCITGYGCEDLFIRRHVRDAAMRLLQEIAAFQPEGGATEGMVVTVGLPLEFDGAVFNVVAVINNGTVRGFYAKQNLASDGVHYEGRWFKPWPVGVVTEIRLPSGERVPLGDVAFECETKDGRFTFGFEICEDAWVASRPGIALARKAIDVILNPSASHFAFGKTRIRERFVTDGSRAFNCAYVYANLLGNEAGRIIYDGDCLIANGGELIAKGRRFGYARWRLLTAVVDLEPNRIGRLRSFSFRSMDRPLFDAGKLGTCREPISKPIPEPAIEPFAADGYPDQTAAMVDKANEFLAAETLALFDYGRKTRTRGFVISLSGGADSTLCAILIREMARAGFEGDEVDQAQFREAYPEAAATGSIAGATGRLLTCIYQGTTNSSEHTLRAAREVSAEIGARFENVSVQDTVEKAESFLSAYLGRPLDWAKDDLTRQNVQARARALLPWTIANAENKLNITTSNRSEAAVGYATMDGDTAGSIGPLGGIDKASILNVLDLLAARFPSIRVVRAKVPTAELKPAEANQSDEKDLMPYPVLDAIERAAILHGKGPAEVVADGIATEAQAAKFYRLFAYNQWKRERYAPSFHVDTENLDPRSFTRFPILNGGFAE